MTKEERRALDILEKTCKCVEGRYKAGLLQKEDNTILPYNRQLAIARLESLEKRLSRDPYLAARYSDTI